MLYSACTPPEGCSAIGTLTMRESENKYNVLRSPCTMIIVVKNAGIHLINTIDGQIKYKSVISGVKIVVYVHIYIYIHKTFK